MSDFFNPYAFSPAPRREDLDGPSEVSLGRLRAEQWTGRLRVRLTALTPLLVTEQDADSKGQVRRRTRVIDGQVVVAPSSLKGMVRSEFEMVTNSRFGVFHERGHPFGFRQPTESAQALVPVRVVVDGDRHMVIPLRGKPSPRGGAGRPMLPAAWVPMYRADAVPIPAGIEHGCLVWAWVVEMRRETKRKSGDWRTDFHYWRALEVRKDKPLTSPAVPDDSMHHKRRHAVVDRSREPTLIRGWYFCGNRNVDGKHDERIFFADGFECDADSGQCPQLVPVAAEAMSGWADLIADYHAAHDRAEIHERTRQDGRPASPTDYLGHEPGKPAWSWHLVPEGDELGALMALPQGTLCYAFIAKDVAVALYPVSLSRRLYDKSPAELAASARLAPAVTHAELSPAERLFGWVPPEGRGSDHGVSRALRGRVRFGPVTASGADPELVERGLAVLERPRPSQDLFYAASDPQGRPLAAGRGYREGQGLRGRKVYPHQPDTTWEFDRRQQWLFRGVGVTAGGEPLAGSQNAILADWIPVGARLECDLWLENLTDAELGGLLYVLRGQDAQAWERRIHKFGGGKPLGFGSVTIQVVDCDMRRGEAWRSYFALEDQLAGNELDLSMVDKLVCGFTEAIGEQLAAYEKYLEGFPTGTPVRYPADPVDPEADEKRYAWFVRNRSGDRDRLGLRRPLGELTGELGLPTDPTRPKPPQTGKSGHRR